MSCKFTYKNKEYTEKGLIKAFALEEITKNQGNRVSSDYTKEELTDFVLKIDELKKSMDVEVVIDSTVDSSKVLAKSDPRTKMAGKPVIMVNPNAIFKTTAIHEFGHIFIDSFPKGMNNPRLKRAYAQLEGTELDREVREKYSSLSEDQIRKEVIVTAIGREGADIWDNEQDYTKFQHFIQWFKDFINRTFGVASNEITGLTRELLSSKVKKGLLSGLEDIEQRELAARTIKTAEEKADRSTVNQNKLEAVYQETLTRLANIVEVYRPKNAQDRIKEAAKQAKAAANGYNSRYETVKELMETLRDLDIADRRLGLSMYIDWVKSESNLLNRSIKGKIAKGVPNRDKEVFVGKALEWNKGFDMIEEIQDLTSSFHRDKIIDDEEREELDKRLSEIQSVRDKIVTDVMEEAKKLYARTISKHDTKVKAEYEKGFSDEYDRDKVQEATGQSRQEYIIKKLNENKDEIENEAYYVALNKANESITDIHAFTANFMSEKGANSQDIQIISKMIDDVELKISQFAQSQAERFDENNDLYEKDVGKNFNQEKKYEKMIDKSGENVVFASEYKSSFNEEHRKLSQDVFDQEKNKEKYGDIKVNEDGTYTNEAGEKRQLLKEGYENRFGDIVIKGDDITFMKGGEEGTMTIGEAIARTELSHWVANNTKLVQNKGEKGKLVPSDNWLNEDFAKLTEEERSYLDFLKNSVKEAEGDYAASQSSASSLISNISGIKGTEVIRLPGVLKSQRQILVADKDGKSFIKRLASELTSIQKDDFETAESKGKGVLGSIKVLASVSNNEIQKVPVPYKNKLSKKEQSYDLHTIVLMNRIAARNHKEKSEIESTLNVLLEVMKDKKVIATNPLGKKKIHASSPEDSEIDLTIDKSKGISNEAKKAADIIANRLYDIKSIDAGEIKLPGGRKANVQQSTKAWLKISGLNALFGNLSNSIISTMTGTFGNIIEAVGGEHFNLRDWGKAKKIYAADLKDILGDVGKNVQNSRTNRLMKSFNVIGSKTYLDSNFEDMTRAHALANANSLRPFANMGEHMMQAQTMYAVLSNIKVMNKDGKFIDTKGNIVKSKKQAASMNEMIEFNDGAITLNKNVGATTFTLTGGPQQILLETRNLVKNKIFELHGNYDADLQAAAQRQAWGKIVFFLRKWLEGGVTRRWRGLKNAGKNREDLTEADKFYSQDIKDYREGYYTTAARFVFTLMKSIKSLRLDVIKKQFKGLSAHEKANLYKALAEVSAIVLTFLAYGAMDEEDEDMLKYRYILRREAAELSFFLLPTEAIKVVSTPSASVGMLTKMIKLMDQMTDPTAVYEQGKNKDRSKLWVKFLKTIPGFSQTEKDLEASLNFMSQGGI